MSLTSAQIATLRADIIANNDLNSNPNTPDGAYAIAALYNVVSTQDVWQTSANVASIYDAIDWTKFTPNDAVDSTVIYSNRVLLIQTKQMNLQNILTGRTQIDASKANVRAGLRDAVIALPSGASGAAISAGGSGGGTVLSALTRKANRYEKLFAVTSATTGPTSANLLVVEGQVSIEDVLAARAN